MGAIDAAGAVDAILGTLLLTSDIFLLVTHVKMRA